MVPSPPNTTTSSPAGANLLACERQNLTTRMNMLQFTWLTNAFSKKVENLYYAVSIHFMHYNFARIRQSLRVTPAMEAGVSDHVWTVEEIVGLLEKKEQEAIRSGAMKRGPYKKRATKAKGLG